MGRSFRGASMRLLRLDVLFLFCTGRGPVGSCPEYRPCVSHRFGLYSGARGGAGSSASSSFFASSRWCDFLDGRSLSDTRLFFAVGASLLASSFFNGARSRGRRLERRSGPLAFANAPLVRLPKTLPAPSRSPEAFSDILSREERLLGCLSSLVPERAAATPGVEVDFLSGVAS